MTSRNSTAALALLLLPLGAYVGGYFYLGRRIDWYGMFPVLVGDPDAPDVSGSGPPSSTLRTYRKRWMTTFYTPAGWIEEKVRGVRVNLDSYDEP